MDQQAKDQIYDRLSEISLKIEVKNVPDPRYISEKLGQCHILIEEIERFYIQVDRELSVYQTALNNSSAAYDQELNDLISSDPEITNLPSVRDREARASTRLKVKKNEIKELENQAKSLEALQKTINMRLRSLIRADQAIKVQLRLMEAQIKLGSSTVNDSAARSLAEEMSKSHNNEDLFGNVRTTSEDTIVCDPSEPITDKVLLNPLNNPLIQDEVANDFIKGMDFEEETSTEEDEEPNFIKNIKKFPEDDLDTFLQVEKAPEETVHETITELDGNKTFGGSSPIKEEKVITELEQPKTETKTADGFDSYLGTLLSQFN